MIELNTVYNENCLIGMSRIPDKSIDLILADLPYGTTACKWDTIIPFEPLWEQYERVIKDNGAIVLTASQPFTTDVINSNRKIFKYCWIWDKISCTGAMLAKKQPMRAYEDIAVFYKIQPTYNPQLRDKPKNDIRINNIDIVNNSQTHSQSGIKKHQKRHQGREIPFDKSYPTNVVRINNYGKGYNRLHPTQKPVALFEYLIKTYTNEGETVLDNCMGSFTTAISAINTNRNYIGFEMDENYFKIGSERVKKHMENKTDLFNIAI